MNTCTAPIIFNYMASAAGPIGVAFAIAWALRGYWRYRR